jgi:hypothetical protein
VKSAEQEARDLLEQCGVEDAQSFSAGDVVALANLIADVHDYRRQLAEIVHLCTDFTPDPGIVDAILDVINRGGSR